MTKAELSALLHKTKIPVNEGITSDKNMNTFPRIVYWDYIWEDIVASGQEYDTKATYQVSFYSKVPRDKKLLELRNHLREAGMYPVIYHEYGEEDKVFHSYFALEVME